MLLDKHFDAWKRRQVVVHTLAFYGKKIAKKHIVRLFIRNRIPILSLVDKTRPPHNGCRLIKRRRK
jgi:ribosomal protein S11